MQATRACSVEGCDRPWAKRDWCTAHYKRWQRHGDPTGGGAPHVPGATCTLESCDQPHYGRGLCSVHYMRQWSRGTTDPVQPIQRPACAADDCQRSATASGYCYNHGRRLDPANPIKGTAGRVGPASAGWRGDEVSYNAMHFRVRRERGRVANHQCSHCSRTARHWAYDHSDPNPRTEGNLQFSTDTARYIPLCTSCHGAFDANWRRS